MKRQALSLAAILFVATFITNCSKKGSSSTPGPSANFTYSGAGVAPVTVTFTNTSTDAFSYLWDFGDNTTSTSANPSHDYMQGGVYTVKLTATGAGGSNSITKTVNIQSPTSVKILGVKVTQMSFTDGSGGGWDNASGPDVYYSITDVNDVALVTSATFLPNATAASLPIIFTLNPAYQITNFTATYKVKIWDYDLNDVPPNADDFIGGYQFNFSGAAASGYPVVMTLFVAGSTLKIDLVLQWQ
jgi:PKD repeat protein